MTQRKLAIFLVLLLEIPSTALADLADELVDLTSVRENLNVAVAYCTKYSNELLDEEYMMDYQADELGLAPDDPARLQLAQIYHEYYEESCSRLDIDELTDLFAEMYEEQFDESELAEIVAFHKTQAGSKYVSVSSAIGVELNQVVNHRMIEGAVEA